MSSLPRNARNQRGQMIVLAALAMTAILLGVGLVIDGGNAVVQRRQAQNAADLAALAGSRVIALQFPAATRGNSQDVKTAIETALTGNGVNNSSYSAFYVNSSGAPIAAVTATGLIPDAGVGVKVDATRPFKPYMLGLIGVSGWSASATATAKAGYVAGTLGTPGTPGSIGGDLLPIAVALDHTKMPLCPLDTPASSCELAPLSPLDKPNEPEKIAPGQFGWMSWNGTGNTPYLCDILGPPAHSPTYVIDPNGFITISGNTGVSNADCVRDGIAAWVASKATVLVPIVSPGPPLAGQNCTTAPQNCFPNSQPYPQSVQGNGSKAKYNIIGFAGFQLTGCSNPCIKNLQGVFRRAIFLGPTTGTPGKPGTPGHPGTAGSALAVQLVR